MFLDEGADLGDASVGGDGQGLTSLAKLDFDLALADPAPADHDAEGEADQLGILELGAGTLMAVNEAHVDAGGGQLAETSAPPSPLIVQGWQPRRRLRQEPVQETGDCSWSRWSVGAGSVWWPGGGLMMPLEAQ